MRVLYALLAVLCLKSVRSEPTACKSIDSADGLFRSGSVRLFVGIGLRNSSRLPSGTSLRGCLRWL